MSQHSGDSLSSMSQIQLLAAEAMEVLNNHRHKTILMPDCPECRLKLILRAVQEEAEKALTSTV